MFANQNWSKHSQQDASLHESQDDPSKYHSSIIHYETNKSIESLVASSDDTNTTDITEHSNNSER